MVSFKRSIVLWATLLATIHFKCIKSSSSSSCSSVDENGEIQQCRSRAPDSYSRDGFYCPFDQMCKPATERCLYPPSEVCRHDNGEEQGCGYSSSTGRYDYYLGKTPLFSSVGSGIGRKKRGVSKCLTLKYELKHNFVDYRGFTYEFGCYGVQVLDKNDPAYKYRSSNVTYYERHGSSDCTHEELKYYAMKYWANTTYELCSNNCQDFARGLRSILSSNCQKIRAYIRQGTGETASLPDDLVRYFYDISGGNCYKASSKEPNASGSAGAAPHGALVCIFLLCLGTVVNRLFA